MSYQPYIAAIDLRNAPVLVIGGGRIGTRKALALIQAGANITVIAPELHDELRPYLANGRIRWINRKYRTLDLNEPAVLIFAATDDGELNARIVEDGKRRGRLVNGASKGSGRNFSTPASFVHGGLTFSVASGGEDLDKAIAWRNRLRDELGSSRTQRNQGHITLVGSGPGNVDLLTLGGRRAIANADVIVYDHLVSDDVLRFARPDAELVYAGKEPFGESVAQEEINSRLVAHALKGKHVVRLKGGDPFIFGRGAEEIEVLHRAGITFDVIPGVSSLNGALAAAGVSITKRGRNQGFAVVAATPRTSDDEIRAWGAVPGPVAIFMGVHAASRISRTFIEEGRDVAEPVSVISKGGTPEQRVAVTTLAELPVLLKSPEEWTPALIVVGVEPEAAFRVAAVETQKPAERVCREYQVVG